MAHFHLDVESWIPVELLDGSQQDVSLLTAIRRAETIRRVTGNPPEAAVLMRLLLAVAHLVRHPRDIAGWESVWQDVPGLLADMEAYVVARAGAYNLYDQTRPFLQHPGLPEPHGTTALLGYDRARGNVALFFDHSQVSDMRPIPSAQAARGLLINHAFGGSHPGGVHPLTGRDAGSLTAGPLCGRAVAILEAENLAKTIALNIPYGRKPGRPGWERPVDAHPGPIPSEGLADRFTRTTRFAALRPDSTGQHCLAASFSVGQQIDEADGDLEDPMIPRFLSDDKKIKHWRLSADRAVWRAADVLLVAHVSDRSKEHAPPLRALEQLRVLVGEGTIPETERVLLRVIGVLADAKGPKNTLWRDETLRFDLSIIADDQRYEDLRRAIEMAEEKATDLRHRLYGFARAYLAGAKGNPDPKDVGRLTDELAPDLSGYWSAIGPQGERLPLGSVDIAAWQKTLETAASRAFREAVERLPADSRRYRAEFARTAKDENAKGKQKKVKV